MKTIYKYEIYDNKEELIEIYKYDDMNNLIYFSSVYGIEYTNTYDKNNNIISQESLDGKIEYYYDTDGNLILEKYNSGKELQYKYNEYNDLIYYHNNKSKYSKRYFYNYQNNNYIMTDSNNIKIYYKYNSKKNITYFEKYKYDNIIETKNNIYDNMGYLIKEITTTCTGKEILLHNYEKRDKYILYNNSLGIKKIFNNNNLIYYNGLGRKEYRQYDENNRIIKLQINDNIKRYKYKYC